MLGYTIISTSGIYFPLVKPSPENNNIIRILKETKRGHGQMAALAICFNSMKQKITSRDSRDTRADQVTQR